MSEVITQGKYKPYPAYKDSGIEWLSELPNSWGLVRVKNESTLKARIGWQNLRTEEFIDEGPYCVTGTDFNNGSINWGTAYHVSEKRYLLDKNIQLQDGDLLITKDGTIGKLAIVDNLKGGQATLNSGVFILRPNKSVLKTKFMYWVMSSSIFSNFVKYVSNGSTISHLYQADFYNMYFGLPTLNEQRLISIFLDRETQKIDTLIEKQQKMIELLKEKRQAVISHAVTKGLNPNASMKDSGIEWLGEIPEHWNSGALKHYTLVYGRIGFRGYTTSDIVDEGQGAITMSPSNIQDNVVSFEKSTYLSWEKYHESPEIQVSEEDVVFVKTGSTLGKTGYVQSLICETTLNPQLVVFKKCKWLNRWLYYILNSSLVQAYVDNSNSGGTVPTMSQEKLLNYLVPIPPNSEQSEIVSYLDNQTQKIDTLIDKSQQAIELLKERKTALISAAVTGKIDVRGAL